MFSKLNRLQLIFLLFVLSQFSSGESATPEEVGQQVGNRLKHYIKRLELVGLKGIGIFSSEIEELAGTFKHALAEGSFDEQYQLVQQYTNNSKFSKFLSSEFDKQFINEDILLETWYLNEVKPYLDKDLSEEVENILKDFKEVYRIDDLDKKLERYSDIGEKISEKFLDYFYGENEPVPLMNAQLKYYQEYLQYLIKEGNLPAEFEKNAKDWSHQVEEALSDEAEEAKDKVLDLFDDLSTKFGRYLDEHYADFKMHKFGE